MRALFENHELAVSESMLSMILKKVLASNHMQILQSINTLPPDKIEHIKSVLADPPYQVETYQKDLSSMLCAISGPGAFDDEKIPENLYAAILHQETSQLKQAVMHLLFHFRRYPTLSTPVKQGFFAAVSNNSEPLVAAMQVEYLLKNKAISTLELTALRDCDFSSIITGEDVQQEAIRLSQATQNIVSRQHAHQWSESARHFKVTQIAQETAMRMQVTFFNKPAEQILTQAITKRSLQESNAIILLLLLIARRGQIPCSRDVLIQDIMPFCIPAGLLTKKQSIFTINNLQKADAAEACSSSVASPH